jgi:hypothetical protein
MNTTDTPIIIAKPDGTPLPPGYLLTKNRHGKFVMKVTLDFGDKFVGTRMTIPLRTADPARANEKRDTLVAGFKDVGILARHVVILEGGTKSPVETVTG